MSDIIVNILSSDAFINTVLTLIAGAATALFGWLKTREIVKDQDQEVLRKAYRELEASVHAKAQLAQELKDKRGGKLTAEDQEILKNAVIDDLKDLTVSTGFDVVSTIGPRMVGPAITHVVRRLKGKAFQDHTALPSNVADMFPDTQN